MYTGLVMVDVSPLKFELARHVKSLIGALLTQLVERTRASSLEIISALEHEERTVLRVSTSTEECLQLAKDIAASEALLAELTLKIHSNKEVEAFLEGYRCAAIGTETTIITSASFFKIK